MTFGFNSLLRMQGVKVLEAMEREEDDDQVVAVEVRPKKKKTHKKKEQEIAPKSFDES